MIVLDTHASLALPEVLLLPLTPAVAVRAAQYGPAFPGDPADRLIAATALIQSTSLVTKDERLREIVSLPTIR